MWSPCRCVMKIRWNFLSVDATGDWEACTFLSNWGRKRGRFVYRINPKIVDGQAVERKGLDGLLLKDHKDRQELQ